VVVVGSANVDLSCRVDRLPTPGETVIGRDHRLSVGGKGLNQALMARRCGASVAFVGAVGDDDHGVMIRSLLDDEAVSTVDLATVSGPSGLAMIVVDRGGENSIVVAAGANRFVGPPTIPAGTGVVLTQLEIPVGSARGACEQGRAVGALTILNPAPAVLDPEQLGSFAGAVDILVPNEHELEELGGADNVLSLGISTLIVTRGAGGVDVYGHAGRWREPIFDIAAVDTTGAGDAFCGALAARLALGDHLRSAVRWGAAAGAVATTLSGATTPDATIVSRLAASRT